MKKFAWEFGTWEKNAARSRAPGGKAGRDPRQAPEPSPEQVRLDREIKRTYLNVAQEAKDLQQLKNDVMGLREIDPKKIHVRELQRQMRQKQSMLEKDAREGLPGRGGPSAGPGARAPAARAEQVGQGSGGGCRK